MEKGSFSDYLFAKMSPDTNNGITGPADCTVESGAPRELTKTRKWIAENMLLLVTLCGVVIGIILGELLFFFINIVFLIVVIDKTFANTQGRCNLF